LNNVQNQRKNKKKSCKFRPNLDNQILPHSKSFKTMAKDTPLWEVFIRSRQGLDHKHVGSLHATDAKMALQNARDVYTRRMEGVSIWVVESSQIHASNPDESEPLFDPAQDKIYRHPTFYNVPDSITHM
jgi:ring-1,2-phenylacetyl-CoA epoxidase subunit PaaB